MDINEIWKQFGNDVKKVDIKFEPENNIWRMSYESGINNHVEKDSDMVVCAEKMLYWYKNLHTYKAAAENMWNILDIISGVLEQKESLNKQDSNIFELCKLRKDYINMEDGVLKWNPQYENEAGTAKPNKPTQTNKKTTNTENTLTKVEEPVLDMSKAPNDGFPPFFVKDSISGYQECWGFGVDGNRIHVCVDKSNPENCKIDNSIDGVNADHIIEISENEYNEMYDMACNTIMAVSMGYGGTIDAANCVMMD